MKNKNKLNNKSYSKMIKHKQIITPKVNKQTKNLFLKVYHSNKRMKVRVIQSHQINNQSSSNSLKKLRKWKKFL